MRQSVMAGVAAGAVAAAVAVGGVAVAAAGDLARPPAPPGAGGMMGQMVWPRQVVQADEAGYLAEMVAHHTEAVKAAEELERSGRAEMRELGASIVRTQTAEIATMKAWLARWYPGRAATHDYQPMMRDLSDLQGDALDRAFLEDMIPHHMMAIMMSQRLLMHQDVRHQEVAAFAERVRDDQHEEVFLMSGYLRDWFGGTGMPCPMPGRPGDPPMSPWPGGPRHR